MDWVGRFVVAVALLAIGVILSPETFGSGSGVGNYSTYFKLVHLLCFSTAWGAAVWVTFGGIMMFKVLPRHQLGNLRTKMFPAYFTLVGVCCSATVASFGYLHPWKSASQAEKYQLVFLAASFVFNLANLFIFTPMIVQIVNERHKLERQLSIGEEMGWWKNREAAKVKPELAAMNNKFGVIHALSAVAFVLASFGCLSIHSCYLAAKLNL